MFVGKLLVKIEYGQPVVNEKYSLYRRARPERMWGRMTHVLPNQQSQNGFCARLWFVGKNSRRLARSEHSIIVVSNGQLHSLKLAVHWRSHGALLSGSPQVLLRASAQMHDVNAGHQDEEEQQD